MRDHTKLRAFELADEVAVLIYRATKKFPKEEVYGLTSQMRRAAVSAPSNIVEGCARESQAEYLRFLEIAFGSLRERKHLAIPAERKEIYPEGVTHQSPGLPRNEATLGWRVPLPEP